MRLTRHKTRIKTEIISGMIVRPFADKLIAEFMKLILFTDYLNDCKGCKWNTYSYTDTCELCTCGDFYERSVEDEHDGNRYYCTNLFNLDNLKRARQKAIGRSKYVK